MENLEQKKLNDELFSVLRGDCDLEEVVALLDKGADVNAVDDYDDGNSSDSAVLRALEFCNSGYVENVFNTLVQRGANLDAPIRTIRSGTTTALVYFSDCDAGYQVKLLIEAGASVNAKDSNGKTALINAVYNNNHEETKLLLDNGADYDYAINYFREHDLHDGEDYHFSDSINDDLLDAAYYSDYASTLLLLKAGADVNYRDEHGKTAFSYALENNSGKNQKIACDIAKTLWKSGATVSEGDLCSSLDLRYSRDNGGYEVDDGGSGYDINDGVELYKDIIRAGASVDDISNGLIAAIVTNDIDVAKFLVENGADVNVISKNGESAFSIALYYSSNIMPNFLIEHGAKISDADIDRAFDSHFIYNRQSEVYKSLITLGADINRKDEYGRTPLVRSAINNDENAFEFLLKNGADITIVDNENKTVSDYAKGKVAEILKSHTENKHLDALIDVESDEEEFDFFNSPPPASYQTLYEKETLKNKDLMAALDAKDEVIDELATALAKSEKANTLLISINNNQAKLLGQNKTQEVAPVATKAAVIERE